MAEIYQDLGNVPFNMELKGGMMDKHLVFLARVRAKYPELVLPNIRILLMDPEFQAEIFQLVELIENDRPKIKHQFCAPHWGAIPGVNFPRYRK